MTKTITVQEYRRQDGTVVPEHERVIEPSSDDSASNRKRNAAIGAAGVVASGAAFLAMRRFNGVLFGRIAGDWSDVNRAVERTPLRELVDKSVRDALPINTQNFPLKKFDSLDAPITTQRVRAGTLSFRAIDQPDYGFFTRKAYKPLEGSSRQETLRNVESFIKGKSVEHSFVVDSKGAIKAAYRGDQHAAPIFIPSRLGWKQTQNLTFTHNHPSQVPYSGGDLGFQLTNQIGVGRAVLPDGTVSQMTLSGSPLRFTSIKNTNETNRILQEQERLITEIGGWSPPAIGHEVIPDAAYLKVVNSDRYYKGVIAGYRSLQEKSGGLFRYEEFSKFVKREPVRVVADISKIDDEKRQVFGWASITELNGQPVIDLQSDLIETVELEKAAYGYVMNSRVGGEMHQRVEKSQPKKVADLIESMVLTNEKIEKMGLPPETPRGWWIGFQIGRDSEGDRVWDAVKKGKYAGFSIHGLGRRVEKTIDEVEKKIVQVDQYTRRDGTVVEAHEREINTQALANAAVDTGLGGATAYISSRYARSGKRGLAIAYGAYALFSLMNAATNLVPEVLRQVRGDNVVKASPTKDQFDTAVQRLAEEVDVEPEEFLARLGAFLDEEDELTEDGLVQFMETFSVAKFLTEEVR